MRSDLLPLPPDVPRTPDVEKCHADLGSLQAIYRKTGGKFTNEDGEIQLLQKIVKSCFDFCTAVVASISPTSLLAFSNRQVHGHTVFQNTYVKQLSKIGRYWDFCLFVTKATRQYPNLFRNLRLELLRPYMPVKFPIPNTKETTKCYVHAEIQLVTFYGLTPLREGREPRVLGVSKSACYLCALFISLHGQYFISRTHGHLYREWTIPNLATFGPGQRAQYRTIILKIYQICRSNIVQGSRLRRGQPAESDLDFGARIPLSPIAATTVTNLSQATIQDLRLSTQMHHSTLHLNHVAATENGEQDPTVATPSAPTVPGPSPLPSRNEIDEHPRSDLTVKEEVAATNDRMTSPRDDQSPSSSIPTTNGYTLDSHLITHHKPYDVVIRGTHLIFEIETPHQGTIAIIKNSPNKKLVSAINVDAMTPGDILDLYREENETLPLNLEFRRKNNDPISIEMQWLPS